MRHLRTFELIEAVAELKSIRKASTIVAMTPSAVQRRIQAFEDEVGTQIFERVSKGVELNAAGELVIDHIKKQKAEIGALKSRLADLQGTRAGHVKIACSQGLGNYFIPTEIAKYRNDFKQVTFEVLLMDHSEAHEAVSKHEVDFALTFEIKKSHEIDIIIAVEQNMHAVMKKNHPLAKFKEIRLVECMEYPIVLPLSQFAGRQLVEKALLKKSLAPKPVLQSNSFNVLFSYLDQEEAITFQIPLGIEKNHPSSNLTSCMISKKDLESSYIYLVQKRGRVPSVATARFLNQLLQTLSKNNT